MTVGKTEAEQQKDSLWSILVLLLLNAPGRTLRIPKDVLAMTMVADIPPMTIHSQADPQTGDLVLTVTEEDTNEDASAGRYPRPRHVS